MENSILSPDAAGDLIFLKGRCEENGKNVTQDFRQKPGKPPCFAISIGSLLQVFGAL